MKDWTFLKKPEFWVTTLIALALTFFGGYLSGKYIVSENYAELQGEFSQLQNEYLILNSSYNNLQFKETSGSIITNNQQGGTNTIINEKSQPRRLNETIKYDLNTLLKNYIKRTIQLEYVSDDSEAYNFAYELREYLTQRGYIVEVSSIMPLDRNMEGATYKFTNDGTLILTIGHQKL